MKRIWLAALAAALVVPAAAGEHPSGGEHPTGKEHPTGHEHPKESKRKSEREIMKAFTAAVESYIEEETEANDGTFYVWDEKLGDEWQLKLDFIHKKRIVRLGDDEFFACADFDVLEDEEGERRAKKVDLDFYVTHVDGEWFVEDVLVHKVDGEERFTYSDDGERVPVEEDEGG